MAPVTMLAIQSVCFFLGFPSFGFLAAEETSTWPNPFDSFLAWFSYKVFATDDRFFTLCSYQNA